MKWYLYFLGVGAIGIGLVYVFFPPPLRINEKELLFIENFSENTLCKYSADSSLTEIEDVPSPLKKLEIKTIRISKNGIYFKCWSFFVLEKGFFVPSNISFFYKFLSNGEFQDGDCHYRKITKKVFVYYISG